MSKTPDDLRREHEALIRSINKEVIGMAKPVLPSSSAKIPKSVKRQLTKSEKLASDASSQLIAASFVENLNTGEPDVQGPVDDGDDDNTETQSEGPVEASDSIDTPEPEENKQREVHSVSAVAEIEMDEPPAQEAGDQQVDAKTGDFSLDPEQFEQEKVTRSYSVEPSYSDGSSGVAFDAQADWQIPDVPELDDFDTGTQPDSLKSDEVNQIEEAAIMDTNPAHANGVPDTNVPPLPAIRTNTPTPAASFFNNGFQINQANFDSGNSMLDGFDEAADNTLSILQSIAEKLVEYNIRLELIEAAIDRID